MEPDAWKTVLDKIKDSQDRRTASELMRVLFESLVDTEFDVLGRPATLRGGAENQFGYSVTENEKERCYDITVTNCERLSMRKMVKNLSRHKHVREIEVCNYGPDRGAFRNMTVTLRMRPLSPRWASRQARVRRGMGVMPTPPAMSTAAV